MSRSDPPADRCGYTIETTIGDETVPAVTCYRPTWVDHDYSLFAVSAAILPDIDIPLKMVIHPGVTHTLVFAVGARLVGSSLITSSFLVYQHITGRYLGEPTSFQMSLITLGGLFIGMTSHVLVDVFTTLPGNERPVEPLWPVWTVPVSIELLPPFSNLLNGGFALSGLLAASSAYQSSVSDRSLFRSSDESM